METLAHDFTNLVRGGFEKGFDDFLATKLKLAAAGEAPQQADEGEKPATQT